MTERMSFKVRHINGPYKLFFHHPVELRFHIRASGEVVCEVPYLQMEVGGNNLEHAMDLAVKAIRALAMAYMGANSTLLAPHEKQQMLLVLSAVDTQKTFGFFGQDPDTSH